VSVTASALATHVVSTDLLASKRNALVGVSLKGVASVAPFFFPALMYSVVIPDKHMVCLTFAKTGVSHG